MRPAEAEPAHALKVVYCGGCNPAIDRVAIAGEVSRALAGEPAAGQRVTLYVSGCQRSCAAGHRAVAGDDEAAVVIAGEHVNAIPTAAGRIAAAAVTMLTSRRAAPPGETLAQRRPGVPAQAR